MANQSTPANRHGRSPFHRSGFATPPLRATVAVPTVAELGRSLRREVASTTAERGLVLTQPCLSRQVFYGSRRLVGGASHRRGSGASQTM